MLRGKSFLVACAGEASAVGSPGNTYKKHKSEQGRNRKETAHPTQQETLLPEAVLKSFNTWAFKREQPKNLELMRQMISDAIASDQKISFILYWGKGPRDHISTPDVECLDYLAALAQRVFKVYKNGASITLIFTDTHARLNGYSSKSIHSYFAAVEGLARVRHFSTVWLGSIVEQANSNNVMVAPLDVAPHTLLQHLTTSAHKWYRGPGTPKDGALKYYDMNMVEKRAVELAFPRSIFITFNGGKLRDLFPDRLPIFHMYSLRRGNSVKPWLVAGDEMPTDNKHAG